MNYLYICYNMYLVNSVMQEDWND